MCRFYESENMKECFEKRSVGFILTLSMTALSLLVAIVYAICYAGSEYFNALALIMLIVATLSSVALILTKNRKWAPYALSVFDFVAFLSFIYGIYMYVQVVLVGIDLDHFEFSFILTALLFIIVFIGPIVSIFLKQEKEEN